MGFLDNSVTVCERCGNSSNEVRIGKYSIKGVKHTLCNECFHAIRREKLERPKHARELITLASSRNQLVNCKVCEKPVSELADICPNCGEPLPGLKIQCPKCDSYHVTFEKQGFSVGQATAGAIAFGTKGLVAGMIGSKNNLLVCLGCNYKWSLPKLK